MATVKVIEPNALVPEHLRVAAYCRVSSDSEDQLHSYAAQIRNYTEVIAQHDGWSWWMCTPTRASPARAWTSVMTLTG